MSHLGSNMATPLKEGIFWVGAIDWTVRDFHGYVTERGTSYNSYLIVDEEPTLVDTVRSQYFEEMLGRIKSVLEPASIRYIVIDHIENDHASSLGRIMAVARDAAIFTTERGRRGLERFFDLSPFPVRTVKTGDRLRIGKRRLLFIETPMLHWPDSMMTYLEEDRILISQDAFGQHIASSERFDDEYIASHSLAELKDAVLDYYANILMPFGRLILQKMEEISKLNIRIDMIAPDHGIVWRKDPGMVIEMYKGFATDMAEPSVAIIYDTMWHGTERMIPSIVDGLRDEGLDAKVIKLRTDPTSLAIKEFFKRRGTLIGTPTLNNLMFPSIALFMSQLKGLRPKARMVSAFGCYGWGGGGVKGVLEEAKAMGLEVFEPGIEINFRPKGEDLEKCYRFGREFALRLKEYHGRYERGGRRP